MDNPPAFPIPAYTRPSGDFEWPNDGMSLRDYFAAKAMVGFLTVGNSGQGYAERIAKMSYNVADAMLEARKKGQQ